MNPVIEGLVKSYLADDGILANVLPLAADDPRDSLAGDPAKWKPIAMLSAYLRWMPAAFVIKELHGRVMCANAHFCTLSWSKKCDWAALRRLF